jgi:arabinan endo-1,5-alpha-L-arabinosidase
MAGHGQMRRPSHNAVFIDNDVDILVYHYYDATGAMLALVSTSYAMTKIGPLLTTFQV